MANQLNTLYPPQVATFMPAFARIKTIAGEDGTEASVATDAVVYYSLSPYNEIDKINYVHISVVDQKTNENALTDPTGIMVVKFDPVKDYDEKSGMYRVVIPNNKMKEAGVSRFKINQFYKIQLRFDLFDGIGSDSPLNMKGNALGNYMISKRPYFSEWSSICLIRAIDEPYIVLRDFSRDLGDGPKGYNKGIIPVVGFLSFRSADKNDTVVEKETLSYYQIQVLDEEAKNVLLSTDRIFTGMNFDQNDINYKLDIQGLDTETQSNFILRIIATTKNQYTFTQDYEFQVVDFIEDEFFDPKIKVVMDDDDAIATIFVENTQSLYGVLYIKRASSKDEFKIWEDVYITSVSGSVDLKVYDNTVCSNVWYRYSVQLENVKGGLSPVVKSEKIFPTFFDMVLSRGSRQLSVRYNYIISSFKPVVNRTKVDTLGGRYPKFMENANLNYKQFTVSGLISTQEDPTEKFKNYRETIGSNFNNYFIYKKQNSITEYYDYLWEREFREDVIAWLNDGEPKLYRSQTEGNLCVMITDISLTPNKVLSRRIWDFSATIYEIAEGMSISELHDLGIYNIYADGAGGNGTIGGDAPIISETKPDLSEELYKVGQKYEYNVTNPSDNFVETVIGAELQLRYGGFLRNRMPGSNTMIIKNVRIFFHDKPHAYIQQGGNLIRIQKPDDTSIIEGTYPGNIVLGYRVNINGQDIFVNDRGYYEVPAEVEVESMYFPDASDGIVSANPGVDNSNYVDGFRPEYVTVEYIIVYRETNGQDTTIRNTYVEKTLVGQIVDSYQPNEYLNKKITDKYSFLKENDFSCKMSFWKGISLDVTPFAMFRIKYVDDDTYQEYEVGHSGVLNLNPNFRVEDICFTGVRMTVMPIDRAPYLNPWECVLVDPHIMYLDMNTLMENKPIYNGVYGLNGKHIIYHQDKWYDFKLADDMATGVASIPVEGAINYLGDILTSVY